MNYMTGGRWLEGERFAAWLVEQIGDRPRSENLKRRLFDWARGATVDVYTADEYLVAYGIHAVEIPDELWLEKRIYRRRRCRNGHPRTKANTYKRPDGRLDCRECKRKAQARA